MICALNAFAIVGGLDGGPSTEPRLNSVFPTPLRFKPMLSPRSLLHLHVVGLDRLDLAGKPSGITMTLSPIFIFPVSTLPTGTVPTPVMVYTSWIGMRSGLSTGFGGSELIKRLEK